MSIEVKYIHQSHMHKVGFIEVWPGDGMMKYYMEGRFLVCGPEKAFS